MQITHLDHDGAQLSSAAWKLLHCTSGARLSRALRAAGLPVSGTIETKARRLLANGITTA